MWWRNIIPVTLMALIFMVSASNNTQLPPSIKVCSKSSPNLAACVKDSIESLRPYLKSGELGSGFKIDGLENMKIDDIYIDRGRGFFFSLKNIHAVMVSNFKIEKLKVNAETFNIDAILNIPNVRAYGDYKGNVIISLLNIKGEGKFEAVFGNIKVRMRMVPSFYMKNNEKYVKFSDINVAIKLENLQLKMHDLFKGDKLLQELGDTLVNQNIPLFLSDIEPKVQDSIRKLALRSTNQILEAVPFRMILS